MTLESALYSFLALDAGVYALLGQGGSPAAIKLYFGLADSSVKPPYATFTAAGSPSTGTLTGSTISNTRIQIDAYAKTASGARDLALALNNALDGIAVVMPGLGRVTASRMNKFDKDEPDVRLFCRTQEFSIWHPES